MMRITKLSTDKVEVELQQSAATLFVDTLRDYCESGINTYVITAVPHSTVGSICINHSGTLLHMWISDNSELIITGSIDCLRMLYGMIQTAIEEKQQTCTFSHHVVPNVIAENSLSIIFSIK